MSRALNIAALEWHLDHGADEAMENSPVNRIMGSKDEGMPGKNVSIPTPPSPIVSSSPQTVSTKSDIIAEAVKCAAAANTLDDLKAAIAEFDGIAIKKTATNLVFSSGNSNAKIMLIGEAPSADEDRTGAPFVGAGGQLLDKILKFIDIDRNETGSYKSIYITNILNWRPPGNRTPGPGEIDLSLPFIEKHIALIKPEILILCGAVAARSLLNSTDGISKLRKKWHCYKTVTAGLGVSVEIPAIATYNPDFLAGAPSQKRAMWADMLSLKEKILGSI
jgi:uracil-DNA glycosylase family 4